MVLIDVDDDDANLLLQILPKPKKHDLPQQDTPRTAALSRVRDKLLAEGTKEQKTWVVISPGTPQPSTSSPFPTCTSPTPARTSRPAHALTLRPAPALTSRHAFDTLLASTSCQRSPQPEPASFPFTVAAPPRTPSPCPPVLSLLSPLVTGLTSPASLSLASPKSVAQLPTPENALTFEGSLSPAISPRPWSPQLSSPATTLVASSTTVSPEKTPTKRTSAQANLEDPPYRRSQRQANLAFDTFETSDLEMQAAAALSSMLAGAQVAPAPDGGDDGDGGDEDGEYVAEARGGSRGRGGRGRAMGRGRGRGRRHVLAPGDDCPRNGNRPRLPDATATPVERSVPEMRDNLEQEEQQNDGGMDIDPPGGEQGADQGGDEWITNNAPPSICARAAKLVVKLSLLTTSPERQSDLIGLLLSLTPLPEPSSNLGVPQSRDSQAHVHLGIAELASRCRKADRNIVLGDFEQMISYMELALHIQWARKCSFLNKPSMAQLAAQCNNSAVNERQLQKWLGHGSRLLYLAASATMYIIPMIAAAGCKSEIFKAPRPVIEGLAFALRVPEHLDSIQQRLNQFEFNYFQVAPADLAWDIIAQTQVALPIPKETQLMTMANESCVAQEIRIDTLLDLKKTPCPVTLGTTKAWTAIQREKASVAIEVLSIDDLKDKLGSFYAGGVRKDDTYLLIDTDICEGKVLHLRGANNKFLCFAATNLQDYLPHPDTFVNQLSSVMTGEVFKDISGRIDFTYLAWHCSFYNRYAEKGHTAPKDVHANFVKKRGKSRVNHSQRVPNPSKEIRERPEEAELLSELIQLITIIVEHHIKKLLPDEHREIKIFVTKLPLNERSAAYPFGGFVVNANDFPLFFTPTSLAKAGFKT
ncbi:hypothetical protein DFH07DRAFT_949083 [Mycena maculata]|uniref:Uncharacterized protein n=1 Tax=Mycena maculata TaxID=230809 RepID=A0AAD7KD25_9AGAR|nr:hypothetical protein DFH07DRAFT_949083 [Mycena maculata]